MEKETRLHSSIQYIPKKPGVYMMKDKNDRIIYVGKANVLTNRLRSYFSRDRNIKTSVLMTKVDKIDYIITNGDYESLLLENSLIKQWQPRYNINLKDGKSYPLIRITKKEFPRVFRTRRMVDDGSEYFGPFTNVGNIDVYLDLIERLFPLRKCKGKLKKRDHPCLYYHIGRCSAPCAGKISKEEYHKNVERIKSLLSGNTEELFTDIKKKMEKAAENLQFEKAAEYRDSIQAIQDLSESQRVVDFDTDTRDYLSFYRKDNRCTFMVFQMRGGKLLGNESYHSQVIDDDEENLLQFLLQFYSPQRMPPETLYIDLLTDFSQIERYFKDTFDKAPSISYPKEGRDRSILNMVKENSRQDIETRIQEEGNKPALEDLKKLLGLPRIPKRIEGFDISQLGGKHPVASMVSFLDGAPDKPKYRRFHIKKLNGMIDDYEAVREVVARRYSRVLNEELEQPDLILIDGGKGHVRSAKDILSSIGLDKIPLIGLAKKNEEVFLADEEEALIIPHGSAPLQILQHVRDEAHRFANSFNRRLREKEIGTSVLEEVPGIGPNRSRKILNEYQSISRIIESDSEDLARKTGISRELAEALQTRLINLSK